MPRGRNPKPFWSQVAKGDGCWVWTGLKNGDGYGSVWFGKRMDGTHRVAWTLTNGPIPDGMMVLHRCDNPPCCRPDHLFLGTQADNVRDMHAKGRARKAHGSACGMSKLTEEQVSEIRHRYAAGDVSQTKLAAEYGVSQVMVSQIVRRKTWTEVA